jgi:hypothetical protein
LDIVGFCSVLLNPFGPLHSQETPSEQVKLSVLFSQTGLLLATVGFKSQFEQSSDAPSVSM